MKKIVILLLLLLMAGCSMTDDNSTNNGTNFFGDKVFTKQEVNNKISEGLSDIWQDYMINVLDYYRDDLPDNFKQSLVDAVGEYKYDNYKYELGNWNEYFNKPDDVGEKIHALLDLYEVSPDQLIHKIGLDDLNDKVSNNPKIDLSQYKTYEDGNEYLSYYSYFGTKVLAQNSYIKVEGIEQMVLDYYEQSERVLRISNISKDPVYIYTYADIPDGSDLSYELYEKIKKDDKYDEKYDLTSRFMEDTTNTFMPFYTKDVLMPKEETYLRISYSFFKDFNSHIAFKVYPFDENDINEMDIDTKAKIRQGNISEDIILILENRTKNQDECEFKYATIKGTIYDEDCNPLPFMPFRLTGFSQNNGRSDTVEMFTSYDGSFSLKVPIVLYKTDETYARYTIFVDGERAPQDGKMVTMVIGDLFALNNTIQENVKYSDYIKDRKIYGQKSVFIQPSEEKEYELTIVVPDKYNHLIYDYYEETDYGGQANYYDYNNGVFATVKFHDEESGANQTAYLNVFDEDGNLYFRKQLGIQTPCVCVSYDGSLIGTTISSESINDNNYDFENPSADIGKATIFDINGNKVFELDHGVFEMAISHDNRYVALDVTGENSIGIMDIQNKEILWKDYRGAQIRHLIFSEDDSILYMGSQECICAYDTKTGKMLWQTFTAAGFPIDMIMSSKHLYVSPKATGMDNKLLCIDRKTGETIWSFQTGSRGTKLTISPDETMLFWGNDTGARDNGLYMLNADTGEPLWTLNYGGQAAWFTNDSRYVVIKDYGIVEVFTRDGNKIATTAVGSNSKMSWFVYIKDDLSRILDIAGGGDGGNSGWLYNLTLTEGYDRDFIDRQYEER